MSTHSDLLHIIVNPVSGQGKGPEFVGTYLEPILNHLSRPYELHTTKAPLDAGQIGQRILQSSSPTADSTSTVLIVGGDGTTHEFIEGLFPHLASSSSTLGKWDLILFPFGTANALFSSLFPPTSPPSNSPLLPFLDPTPSKAVIRQLSSLLVYLDNKSSTLPLPITTTNLLAAQNPPVSESESSTASPIPSHVVLSTSLHAHILNTSDNLRATHPGPERFRLAAQKNASRFFEAEAHLYPSSTSSSCVANLEDVIVEQWDPKKKVFVKPFTADIIDANGTVRLKGPFAYFLSTSTVDRLEPTFIITPHVSLRPDTIPPSLTGRNEGKASAAKSTIYVLVLRPLRDPRVRSTPEDSKNRGEVWTRRAFEVLMRAYQAGEHVDLTYPSQTELAAQSEESLGNAVLRGEGEVVVEAFRCAAFDWIPSSDGDEQEDGGANLVCADGSLHRIPSGGKASVRLAPPSKEGGFYVWA